MTLILVELTSTSTTTYYTPPSGVFTQGYRSNLETERGNLSLIGNPTTNLNGLTLSSDASSLEYQQYRRICC